MVSWRVADLFARILRGKCLFVSSDPVNTNYCYTSITVYIYRMKIITFATKFIVASFSVMNIIKLLFSQGLYETLAEYSDEINRLECL